MSYDQTRTSVSDYDITWGSYFLGAVDKVTPNIDLLLKPIKVGSVGGVKLGERILGLADGANIAVECREKDAAMLKSLLVGAWTPTGTNTLGAANSGTGNVSIPIIPKTGSSANAHVDMYDLAKPLTLHPTNQPAGNTNEDLTFYKATPTFPKMERDGVADDKTVVVFMLYPDRTKLPVINYGYAGSTDPG